MDTRHTDAFERRLARHYDELKWLYTELYQNDAMLAELIERMRGFDEARRDVLKALDAAREAQPG